MVTVTLIGLTVTYPSVTLKVTFLKLLFVFSNFSAASPILVVPASVLAAVAEPLNVKSFTVYRSLLISKSYPSAVCSVPS